MPPECSAPTCGRPRDAVTRPFGRPVCRFHAAAAEAFGVQVEWLTLTTAR